MALLGIVGYWLLIGTAVVATAILLVRRRASKIQLHAQALGLTYAPLALPFATHGTRDFSLLVDGEATVARNFLTGTLCGMPVSVFDVPKYLDETVAFTTVALFQAPHRTLPAMRISPKSFASRWAERRRGTSAPITDDREFNSNYSLHCENSDEAHAFVTPERARLLRTMLGAYTAECGDAGVLVYRAGTRIKAERLPDFVAAAGKIASGLLS